MYDDWMATTAVSAATTDQRGLRGDNDLMVRRWVVDAARAGALTTWAQPLYRVSGELDGCEVLARCVFPDGSLRSPDAFAAAFGQSSDWWHLDSSMLVAAVRLSTRLYQPLGGPLTVAWNATASSLSRGYTSLLAASIVSLGASPSSLCLELTEHVPLLDPVGISVLREVRELGVKLALDDIGESYAVFRRLRDVGFDRVKIDRRLTADIVTREGATLIGHVIELSHDLGAEVVAEGVETEAERDALLALGCDVIQGNLLGAAAPAEHFSERAASGHRVSMN